MNAPIRSSFAFVQLRAAGPISPRRNAGRIRVLRTRQKFRSAKFDWSPAQKPCISSDPLTIITEIEFSSFTPPPWAQIGNYSAATSDTYDIKPFVLPHCSLYDVGAYLSSAELETRTRSKKWIKKVRIDNFIGIFEFCFC